MLVYLARMAQAVSAWVEQLQHWLVDGFGTYIPRAALLVPIVQGRALRRPKLEPRLGGRWMPPEYPSLRRVSQTKQGGRPGSTHTSQERWSLDFEPSLRPRMSYGSDGQEWAMALIKCNTVNCFLDVNLIVASHVTLTVYFATINVDKIYLSKKLRFR